MNRWWPNMLQPSLEIWPSLLSWHSFPYSRMTVTHNDSSRQQPHLHPRRSFLMPEDWVQIYFNQKDINYISPSNIRTWVLKPTLPSYTISSPILALLHPWHFMSLPRWASLVCAINIFLVHKVILYKGRNCIDYQLYSD